MTRKIKFKPVPCKEQLEQLMHDGLLQSYKVNGKHLCVISTPDGSLHTSEAVARFKEQFRKAFGVDCMVAILDNNTTFEIYEDDNG